MPQHDYSQLYQLFREDKPLRKCSEFSVFARDRIQERIHPKATSLEKTACIVRMSAESLLWLITDAHCRNDEIEKKSKGEYVSPFVFRNRTLFPQYWSYEVIKAIILSSMYPIESKVPDTFAPDRELNPDFREFWPCTPGTTAYYGAGTSIAEAILQALLTVLEKSCLQNFPDLPNHQAGRA